MVPQLRAAAILLHVSSAGAYPFYFMTAATCRHVRPLTVGQVIMGSPATLGELPLEVLRADGSAWLGGVEELL